MLILARGLCALLVYMVLAFPATAQSLWRESRVGQTVDEVSSLYPAAQPPITPATLGDGSTAELALPGVKVGSLDLTAFFYFKDGALKQVTLQLPESASNATAKVGFESLLEALRAKYGPEISSKDKPGYLSIRNATWMADKTNVTLTLLLVGDAPPILNIVYQVRLSNDMQNL